MDANVTCKVVAKRKTEVDFVVTCSCHPAWRGAVTLPETLQGPARREQLFAEAERQHRAA